VILNGFRINEQKMCVVKDMDLELMSEKCVYVKDTTDGCHCLPLCLYAYMLIIGSNNDIIMLLKGC